MKVILIGISVRFGDREQQMGEGGKGSNNKVNILTIMV
jgi:hypothetical protein